MKKAIFLIACMTIAFAGYTQVSQSHDSVSSTGKMNTLFCPWHGLQNCPIGYFMEVDGGYSHFGHSSVALPGFSAGVILQHHWTFGIALNFISDMHNPKHHVKNETDSVEDNHHSSPFNGGYGGFLFEYTLLPLSKVHVSFPLLLGIGSISHNHYATDSIMSTNKNEWIQSHFTHTEHFFVIEPGVKLELNLIKHMRMGFELSYRYSPEWDHCVTSPDLLNQLTGKISLAFGKF